jgi:hypothetical protein
MSGAGDSQPGRGQCDQRQPLRTTLQLVLATSLAAAVVISALTHGAPAGTEPAQRSEATSLRELSGNAPAWTATYAHRFSGCGPRRIEVPVDLVVVDMRRHATQMGFDEAWRRTHNVETADDVWVVGWCGAAGLASRS